MTPFGVHLFAGGILFFFFVWNTLRSSPILGLRVLERGFCLCPKASACASKHQVDGAILSVREPGQEFSDKVSISLEAIPGFYFPGSNTCPA